VLSQVQAEALRFCEEFTVRRLATSPPIRDIPVTLVRPCDQNVPQNIGEPSPACYTCLKAAQRSSSKNVVAWLHIRPYLVPSGC